MGDTQASFSPSVRNRLRQDYSNRCSICLLVLPDGRAQCAHLFDSSSGGAQQARITSRMTTLRSTYISQVSMAQGYGLLTANFQRNSVRNGFVQCPLCHIAFFTPDHVALSPAIPILHYVNEYLANTEMANRLPLHEVFRLLRDAARGLPKNLPQVPDPTPALPYVDLFSLVILNPRSVTGLRIPTLYLPRVYSIQNGSFRTARTRSATSALIFDVAATGNDTTISYGHIPLSPEQPGFNDQRYWRLPIDSEIILAMLIRRTSLLSPESPVVQTVEIHLARSIFAHLLSTSVHGGAGHGRGGGGGGNIGNAAAGPSKPREREEPQQKKPRTEKADAPNEDLGLGFFIEEIVKRPSDQSLSSCERPHYGVDPKEWVVTTPFSTLTDGEPQAKAYSGHLPSNRESDCGQDNPREWRFGPSFTSNMIIATARQMMNI